MKLTIPAPVALVASTRFQQQAFVPKSPCEIDVRGSTLFCAAAALAYAGLSIVHGASCAAAFESQLAKERSFQDVQQAFALMGWPPELCEMALAQNQGAIPSNDKKSVLNFFAQVAESLDVESKKTS